MRVFFVESNEITSLALRAIIDQSSQLEYVGHCDTTIEAVERVRVMTPDVVLLKWTECTSEAMDAIHRLRQASPRTNIAIFAYDAHSAGLGEALSAGARGVLLRGMSAKAIEIALASVGSGGIWIEGSIWRGLLHQPKKSSPAGSSLPEALSPREAEIAQLIAQGLGNGDIARLLGISRETVKTHISKVMRKTGTRSRTQIAIQAARIAAG